LSDAGVISDRPGLQLHRVQLGQPIEHSAAAGGRQAVGILQEQHGVPAAAELNTLMDTGRKPFPQSANRAADRCDPWK